MLKRHLPPGLVARIDERTVIEDEFDEKRVIIPDVRVVDRGGKGTSATTSAAGLSEPMIIDADEESVTEGFVQVLDTRNGNRVITVIEFASPATKVSRAGREMYKQKQRELIGGGVSLVEVDLIRSGEWNLRAPVEKVEDRGRGLYHVCVTRGWRHKKPEVYAVNLPDRLPVVRVPLRPSDTDITFDLQILFDQTYDNGSYGGEIDYTKPPDPR